MTTSPSPLPASAIRTNVCRNPETRTWDATVTIVATNEQISLGSCARSWDAERLCDDYVQAQLSQLSPAALAASLVQDAGPVTLDGVLVTFEPDMKSDPPYVAALLRTPTYTAHADTDGEVSLRIGDSSIALQPDDLAELERVVSAGTLRRLDALARAELDRLEKLRQAA